MPDPSPAARRRAAAIAGHEGDTAAARSALNDTAAAVRVAALRSLARLATLTDDALGAALSDQDHTVRIAALEVAAPRASPSIVHLLDDAEATVVETAAWACGERCDHTTVSRLCEIARAHDDALARESAVAALGAIGDAAGLAAVLAAMADKPAVRRRAVVALAAFEGPEVDAAWEEARTDRDRQVRDAVDELLGPAEDP